MPSAGRPPAAFEFERKVRGPDNAHLQYIRDLTGCAVWLEVVDVHAPVPFAVCITGEDRGRINAAAQLSVNLLDVVKDALEHDHPNLPGPKMGVCRVVAASAGDNPLDDDIAGGSGQMVTPIRALEFLVLMENGNVEPLTMRAQDPAFLNAPWRPMLRDRPLKDIQTATNTRAAEAMVMSGGATEERVCFCVLADAENDM